MDERDTITYDDNDVMDKINICLVV